MPSPFTIPQISSAIPTVTTPSPDPQQTLPMQLPLQENTTASKLQRLSVCKLITMQGECWADLRPHLLAAMTRACPTRAVNVHTTPPARDAADLEAR